MRFIHLSDLHLGKRFGERSLIEDQRYILFEGILPVVRREAPDGVIIAGDVYDKSIPSEEAVGLLDDFLFALSSEGLPVFLISGNHDSAARIAFGGRLLEASRIHISQAYSGPVTPVVLNDGFGEVNVWLLPFIKPYDVRPTREGEDIRTYNDAVRAAVEDMKVDTSKRNVLVAHQFVTGALTSESEEISVGGVDNVDRSVFAPFDYVALGHLHRPQYCSRETIRYCGTPLKYSFSERNDEKSVTVVDLSGKGSVSVRTVPLVPLHDLRQVRGTFRELTAVIPSGKEREDYVRAVLTDETDVPDAVYDLRKIYPNLIRLDYDNTRTRTSERIINRSLMDEKTPLELFGELFRQQNGTELSNEQSEYLSALIEDIWRN